MMINHSFAAMAGLIAMLATTQGTPLQARNDNPATAEDPRLVQARLDLGSEPVKDSYQACSSRFNGCDGKFANPGKFDPKKKRSLAYWPLWDGLNSEEGSMVPLEKFDDTQLDQLTHLILFGVNATQLSDKHEIDWLPPATRVFEPEIAKKARAKKIPVMVAIGGWGIDTLFHAVQTQAQAENLGRHIAKFAVANGFDGIDIDHEYPTADQEKTWPFILAQIRKDAPNLLLSVALPGTPHTVNTDPKKDPYSGWRKVLKEIGPNVVDFYNVMTYDLLNGYSPGQIAYHHASLSGTEQSVKDILDMLQEGVDESRLNTGFPLYAKYFPMSKCESNEKRLECTLDGKPGDLFPAGKRDDMRFDVNKITKNTNCLEPEKGWSDKDREICKPNGIEDDALKQAKEAEQSFKDRRQFFIDKILPLQLADKGADTYDDQAKADSLWDAETKTFWTWQSPFAIAETCKAMAKSKIGGQFIFAIGQDSSDLVHIKAYQQCMKETYLKDQPE